MRNLHETALDYLQSHHVLTVATQGPLGLWAAAVFYANEAFDLYFLSAGNTRHAQNLLQVPRIAGTIQEDYEDWRAIKGIQLEGPTLRLKGQERAAAIEHYVRKFPVLRDAPEGIAEALSQVDWFRIIPDRLYFIDNSRGFGHRERII